MNNKDKIHFLFNLHSGFKSACKSIILSVQIIGTGIKCFNNRIYYCYIHNDIKYSSLTIVTYLYSCSKQSCTKNLLKYWFLNKCPLTGSTGTVNTTNSFESTDSSTSRTSVNVSRIPKLKNKRKHMEKGLSQAQRDHMVMTQAKEDACLKKQMLDAFDRSNQTLDNSISKMTNCLTALGEGISSGMQMLAMALMPPQAQQSPTPHTPYPPHINPHMYQYQPRAPANQGEPTAVPFMPSMYDDQAQGNNLQMLD